VEPSRVTRECWTGAVDYSGCADGTSAPERRRDGLATRIEPFARVAILGRGRAGVPPGPVCNPGGDAALVILM